LAEILALLKKDLLIEIRSRYAIITALSFALCITVMEGIAFGGVIGSKSVQAALLWIGILFSAMQILPHLFIREEEEGTSLLLRLRFSERSVFFSKLLCTILLLIPVSALTSILFVILMGVSIENTIIFVLLVMTGSFAISCSTSFLASLAARGRFKGALFAVIAVPALLPVLIPAINGTISAISGGSDIVNDLLIIVGYAITTLGLSLLLFGKTWK